MFRCPRCRLFRRAITGSVTFNPAGVNGDNTRLRGTMGSTTEFAKLGSRLLRGSPFSLSNNRGEETTVTNIVTVGPRILILSRPATNLSPVNESILLDRVIRCRGRHGGAIVLMSRDVRSVTEITSGVVIVGGSGLIVFSGAGRIFSGKQRLRGVKLQMPRVAGVVLRLHRGNFGVPRKVLAISRTVSYVSSLLSGRNGV